MLWQAYLKDIISNFGKQKEMAEKALRQIAEENFFAKPGEYSNSIAIIVKHVAGNLASRWTDFLSTDGEKPWRDRDGEFVIGPSDSRTALMTAWERAFEILFQSLGSLQEADLSKKVLIRKEELTVFDAIHRALAHTSYHVGQIVYLSRLLTKEGWQWITMPPAPSRVAKDSR